MRILFIAPYIPSLIRVRPFNFIKTLNKQGDSIYLVCLVTDKKELEDLKEVEKYCEKVETFYLAKYKSIWNCVKYLFTLVSLQSAYCFSKTMKKRVAEILKKEKFDVVHVEFIRGTYFIPKKTNVPVVYDSVDCVTSLYKQFSGPNQFFIWRLIRYVEGIKLEYYEAREAKRFNKVLVTTELEKIELKKLDSSLSIEVITNGVDLEYFKPIDVAVEPFSIVITGKMSYIANELAALYFMEEIWPKVIKEIPHAKMYIVGNDPGERIKKFRSDNIIITGYVADLRIFISKASVVVAPIIAGAGIQNKVLEAMAMGKPVVTTHLACRVFQKDLIKDCLLVEDKAEEFSKAVINVLNNKELATTLGLNAKKFVEEYYDWDQKGKELEEVYRKLNK